MQLVLVHLVRDTSRPGLLFVTINQKRPAFSAGSRIIPPLYTLGYNNTRKSLLPGAQAFEDHHTAEIIHTRLLLVGNNPAVEWHCVCIPIIVSIAEGSHRDAERFPHRVECVFHHVCLMADSKPEYRIKTKMR